MFKLDRVLEEMWENTMVLYQIINSNSKSIQLIRMLMSHVVPHLHPDKQLGLARDTRANLNNEK